MGTVTVTRIFTAVTLALLLAACSSPSDPEAEIRANIEAMQAALAERDNSGFTEHLTETFAGGRDGRLEKDKADVRRMLTGYFLRYRNIHIVVTDLDIDIREIDPQRAYMTGAVAVAGANQRLPESGGLYAVEGEWHNFDGSWKLRSFSWR